MKREWKYSENTTTYLKEQACLESVASSLQLSTAFTKLLFRRMKKKYPLFSDLVEENKPKELARLMYSFIHPSVQNLLFPTFLPDIEKACQIICQSVKKQEKILIWGDYDADGITASAICVEFFEKHGYTVLCHMPNRSEGYGINKEILKKYIAEDIKLIITVDCGISDNQSINFAKEHNIKVIVTDHHTPSENLPSADAIINPHLCEKSENFSKQDIELAGVGVAFFLLCHLNNVLSSVSGTKCDMRDFLDLVALGTIADMVPLLGQNRILVKNGVLKLSEARRISLQALKAVAGYQGQAKLNAGHISFGLAPRINAAGRMGNAQVALELLLCKDYDKAYALAKELDTYNTKRKQEEECIVEEALEQAMMYEDCSSLVLCNSSWNQGVVGIVASRIVEKFHKPTFILTEESLETYKGSGRSISQVDLNKALDYCAVHLLSYGGHKYAAGLKLEKEKLEDFRKAFEEYVVSIVGDKVAEPSLYIDEEMPFSEVSLFPFLKELEMLEPFGLGNAEPVFSSSAIEIKSVQSMGFAKKHLKLELYEKLSGHSLYAKLWNTQRLECKNTSDLSFAYNIGLENYNGITQVSLRIRDFKE